MKVTHYAVRTLGMMLMLVALMFNGCVEDGTIFTGPSQNADQVDIAIHEVLLTPGTITDGMLVGADGILEYKFAIPEQFIVQFKEQAVAENALSPISLSPDMVQATSMLIAKNFVQAEILHVYDGALNGFAARMSRQEAAQLVADPAVKLVQQDGKVFLSGTQYSATWGIDRIDQASLPLNGTYTYDTDGSGVHAYIIDTGLDFGHSQFTGRIGDGWDPDGGNGDTSSSGGSCSVVDASVSSLSQYSTKSYTITGTNVSASTSGGSGDVDLYVKLGSAPTTSSYDCRPYLPGNAESCNLSGTGTWYIMVRAYASSYNFNVDASVASCDGGGGTICHYHGTHVAGTVGGSTWGVAQGVTLHAVRVSDCAGSIDTSDLIAGIDWVKNNHQSPAVANLSIGGPANSTLDTAVRNLISSGVMVAIAAGNANIDACGDSPGRVSTALTVGATTSSDARASYSNYGTCLDLFAPGSSITSAWNGFDAAGCGGLTSCAIDGTSMAAPHVAGVVALYLQSNPSASASQVHSAVLAAAVTGKVTNEGTGSPDLLLQSNLGGSSCTPSCAGDLCGQADGCGGYCSSVDANTCGKCGNTACCTPSCVGDLCGQSDGCGGYCSSADANTCGKCGNAACSGGGDCDPFTYSASGTNNASFSDSDTDKFDVNLTAGVTYVFQTCNTTSTDTYLRLYLGSTQKSYNDDSCSYQSKITYTPSTSGVYTICAGCYGTGSCSGEVLVSPEPTCGDGGSCTPVCTGDLCGQADGCGGYCSSADANTCGKCGNAACASCGDGTCGAGEDCSNCSADCGACGGGTCSSFAYSAISTNSADCNDPDIVKFSSINLTAGVQYTFSTCGSTSTDTYLKLGYWGSTKAFSDNDCGLQSEMVYTPTSTGSYYICAGCKDNLSCNATITVTPEPNSCD